MVPCICQHELFRSQAVTRHNRAANLLLSVYLLPQVMLAVDDGHASAGSAANSAEALRLNDTISFRTSMAQTDLVVNLAIR